MSISDRDAPPAAPTSRRIPSQSVALGTGSEFGWVCHMPRYCTDLRVRVRFSAFISAVPSMPQTNFSGECSLSGGGPLTSLTQITPAASSLSPNSKPPVSAARPNRFRPSAIHERIPAQASAEILVSYPARAS